MVSGVGCQVSGFNSGCLRPDIRNLKAINSGCKFIKVKFEILFGKRFTIHHTCRFNRRSAACHPTARGGFLPVDPGLDNIGGTAHTRCNPDGGCRAVLGACPALHASVTIFDCGFFPFHLKHSVGANVFTHAASHACFGVELQRRYAG